MAGTIPRSCFSPPTERKGKKPKSPSQVAENVGLEWYTPERIFSTSHLKISFKEILALVIFLKVELRYEFVENVARLNAHLKCFRNLY